VTRQRLNAQEAAETLGISVDAVRMRARRGTLDSTHENGRLYVWLDTDKASVHSQGEVQAYRELIEELRDRVRSLENANRENRRIIAALTQRIPELEAPAPSELLGASETAAEEPEREEPWPSTGGPQTGSERPRDTAEFPARGNLLRPWWRRVFGG
jgi:polyhydroxyalkanoate synthesis regulator phasin